MTRQSSSRTGSYARQVELLRMSMPDGLPEILARLGALALGVVLLTLIMPPAIPLLWFAAYAALFLGHTRYIQSLEDEPTRPQYLFVLIVIYAASLLYAVFCVYLILMEMALLQFAGIIGFAGHVIVTLSREMTHRDTAIFDAILLPLVALVITFSATAELATGDRIIAMLLTVSLAAYYVHALHRRYHEHLNHADNRERMFHSQKMEGLGRLTGGIAHDFNNILTALMGNLELTREIDDPTEKEALIDEALLSARRAADLTAQLLAFSGRAPYRPRVIDLNTALPPLIKLADRITDRDCDISITLPDDAPLHVLSDPSQLQNALIAVMLNACEAMKDGGAVRVSFAPLDLHATRPSRIGSTLEAGHYVEIIVKDEGIGITGDALPKVTEPFFTTKPVGDGPGLGLSMARGLTEQSGGGLTISSRPGEGTEVRLALPRADPPD